MPTVPNLKIVPPTEPPPAEKLRQRIRKMPLAPSTLMCRCGSLKLMPTLTNAQYVNGKAIGGTKGFDCAVCGAVVL